MQRTGQMAVVGVGMTIFEALEEYLESVRIANSGRTGGDRAPPAWCRDHGFFVASRLRLPPEGLAVKGGLETLIATDEGATR